MEAMFRLPVDTVQPSQLYICREKLAAVQREFNPRLPETLRPIPIKKLNGQWIFTDGHTRALAALCAGWSDLPVYEDPDELDWGAYAICVDWCLQEGITTIANLDRRVIPSEKYNILWLERCQRMHQDREKAQTR